MEEAAAAVADNTGDTIFLVDLTFRGGVVGEGSSAMGCPEMVSLTVSGGV